MALESTITVKAGYTWQIGTTQPVASEAIAPTLTWVDGTGSGQANFVYKKAISLATTANLDIDLKGGGGELDVLNLAMAATAVKAVLLVVTTPGSGTSLRFGPQNVTDGAQLWFQAATANFYDTVLDTLFAQDRHAGWALDATHKVLRIHNPGASTVAATLWVWGTK